MECTRRQATNAGMMTRGAKRVFSFRCIAQPGAEFYVAPPPAATSALSGIALATPKNLPLLDGTCYVKLTG